MLISRCGFRYFHVHAFNPTIRHVLDLPLMKVLFVSKILLVSSRSEPERWTVAGGGIEPNETGADTSVREAREEVC